MQTKAGDVIETDKGRIKLTRRVYWNERLDCWTAPGYRWIKSRQQFSGNALLTHFDRIITDADVQAHIARLSAADAAACIA